MDAAVERTGMYSQGESPTGERGYPGAQRVQKTYVDQLLYSLVCGKEKQIVEILFKMGGVYCACFVVFHLLFWRIFKWGEDLQSVTFVN